MIFAAFITFVIVVFSFIVWMTENTKTKKLMNKIPGPPTLPFVGNAHLFKPDGSDWFEQVLGFTREHGFDKGVTAMWLSNFSYILLTKPESVEIILNSSKHITKSRDYRFLIPWLGYGLLTSTGEKWKTRRRMITPSFHFRILNDFLQVFNEQSRVMVDRLQSQVQGKGTQDIFPYITLCALDIICDTAMGKTVDAQHKTDSEYVKAIYEMSELINHRQRKPWYWNDFVYFRLTPGHRYKHCLKILHDFTEQVIRERSAEYEATHGDDVSTKDGGERADDTGSPLRKKRMAFLDMLLHQSNTGEPLSFHDIREEVDTFMFEGHDTTAAAANWAVHLIGANPDVQAKLHAEMDDIFGSSNRDVTMDDIKNMKYLECVVKEALRLFPSVPFFARTLEEDVKIGGYDIPQGTTAIVLTSQLHRDERYFPDPEKFDPDRWTLANSAGRHPYCYVPFSAGMRNCIGQKFAMNEEKVILSYIMRHFRIESMQTRAEMRPVAELILRPDSGVHVRLHERQHAL